LRRIGKKKLPQYHIVAADSRSARSGKFIEVVGRYEPLQQPMLIEAKEPRVFYWLKSGARPTDTVRSLFQRNGLWLKWSLTRMGADDMKIAAEMEKWQMGQEEKRRKDVERKERRTAARKAKKAEAKKPAPEPAPAQG